MKQLILRLLTMAMTLGPGLQALAQDNPYMEGLESIQLSESQQKDLAEYAKSSTELLSQALSKAKTLSLDQAYDLYINSIKTVVAASYASKLRQELLTRVILNQCLKLVYGVPSADGKSLQEPGVLAGSQAPEVLVGVMEDSIELAIQYLPKEQGAIEGNKLASLPYTELADKRLVLSWKWSHLVVGWKAQQGILSESLQQWLKIVKRPDNMSIMARSQAITRAESLVAELTGKDLPSQVRMLRAFFASTEPSLVMIEEQTTVQEAARNVNKTEQLKIWIKTEQLKIWIDQLDLRKTDDILACAEWMTNIKNDQGQGFGYVIAVAVSICKESNKSDLKDAIAVFYHPNNSSNFYEAWRFASQHYVREKSVSCGYDLAGKTGFSGDIQQAINTCIENGLH